MNRLIHRLRMWLNKGARSLEIMVTDLPDDTRKWSHFPIAMPVTTDGDGPATIGEDAAKMSYQVWDQTFTSHGEFEYLPDAINLAMELTLANNKA